MSGDAHVQFWEGLGVRLPGATIGTPLRLERGRRVRTLERKESRFLNTPIIGFLQSVRKLVRSGTQRTLRRELRGSRGVDVLLASSPNCSVSQPSMSPAIYCSGVKVVV